MSAFLQSIYEFDLSVFSSVFAIGNDVLDTVMKVITTLGDGWIMPVFAVILLIFKKTRKAGMAMLGALLVMVVLNNEILKPIIARVRPCFIFDPMALDANSVELGDKLQKIQETVNEFALKYPELRAKWVNGYEFPEIGYPTVAAKITDFAQGLPEKIGEKVAELAGEFMHTMPHSWSFPSGHTSSSFAFATAVFSNNKKWGIAAYVLAAVIGFSRIYLGVHYFTDVLAGAVLGVVYGVIGVLVVGAIIKLIKKKSNKLSKLF